MGFDFTNPSSWGDPFVDAANTVADQAQKVARDAVAVAELVGDAVVDGASFIGEGVVTAGTGIEKWGISVSGDAINWGKTSFAEVRDWTENAAGDVAGFTVANFNVAKNAVQAGMTWVYEQLASFFYETLPELGALDSRAQELASYLLTDAVAGGLQSAAKAAGCVMTFGVTIKLLIPIHLGVYVCGDGWGFFAGPELLTRDNLIAKLAAPGVLTPSVSAQVTMVFGPVSRASKAKAVKFGLGMEASPTKSVGVSIGGVVLMEASMPPLFLGLRYAMALDFSLFGKTKDQAPDPKNLKWKLSTTLPSPNGNLVQTAGTEVANLTELSWSDVTSGLSVQANHYDAALRVQADPASSERIQATALAAATGQFKPRYYGVIRTLGGLPLGGNSQGALGVNLAGDRSTVCIVSGLTDPTLVSIEAVGEPPLYFCADAGGNLRLVPYDKSTDLRGTTFRLVRGLTGAGISLAVASDGIANPRFLVATRVRGGIVSPTPMLCAVNIGGNQIESSSTADATFLLDRPQPQPEAATSVLLLGQFLRAGQGKRSPNGLFSLQLTTTGRLVMRRRGSGSLSSPTAWLPYDQPGVIQGDEANTFWMWGSPAPAAAAAYHATVTQDGRIAVRAGADPSQAGATLWQSEVYGTPGPCFLAVTNLGVAMLMRGTPDDPGELLWSSPTGPIYWPVSRRQVVLKGVSGKFLQARNGGGIVSAYGVAPAPAEPVAVLGTTVSGWEAFELQELCTGQVALRAQGRRFVSVDAAGTGLQCLNSQVGPRELFTMQTDSGTVPASIRLRSTVSGANLSSLGIVGGVPKSSGPGLVPPATTLPIPGRSQFNLASMIDFCNLTVLDVADDLTTHSGRPVCLVAKHSGKALEVPSAYTDNGRGLVQGEFLSAEHQKWTLTHAGSGWFTLTNRQTGCSIDITGAQTGSGAVALQWPPHAGDNQRFSLIPTGDGYYLITAKHSGLALTIEGASTARGARVLQMPVTGSDNQRWKLTLASSAPSTPWTALGGGLSSSATISSWGPGRIDICARGLDDAIYQMWSGGSFRPWVGLGGGLLNDPCSVAPYPNRLDVFARGKDNAVYQRWWDGNRSGGWTSLGGQTVASPVALAPRPGRWDLFILGPDRAIWHRYADNGWSSWISLGVALLDPPAAVCRDGRYDLFARGMNRDLYQNSFVNGRWSGWVAIGGSSAGQPAAVTTASGCLDVFMRGTDDQLWTRSFRSGAWGAWMALPGQGSANPGGLLSEPVAISVSASRIDVFVLGSDSALWHRRQLDGKWLPWVRLGAFPLTGKPSVCSSAPGQVAIAVISAEKALWYYRMNG
jgi:hypothetical protein